MNLSKKIIKNHLAIDAKESEGYFNRTFTTGDGSKRHYSGSAGEGGHY